MDIIQMETANTRSDMNAAVDDRAIKLMIVL